MRKEQRADVDPSQDHDMDLEEEEERYGGNPRDEPLSKRKRCGEQPTYSKRHGWGLRYADEGTFNQECKEDNWAIKLCPKYVMDDSTIGLCMIVDGHYDYDSDCSSDSRLDWDALENMEDLITIPRTKSCVNGIKGIRTKESWRVTTRHRATSLDTCRWVACATHDWHTQSVFGILRTKRRNWR